MSKAPFFAALLLCAATIAAAQPSAAPPVPVAPRALCADCGVIRSVRSVSPSRRPAAAAPAFTILRARRLPARLDEAKPPGLVASIPLGGGGKAKVGSATKVGNDAPAVTKTWEVIVRMDDGQFRVLTLESQPDYAKGDRVRSVEGKLGSRCQLSGRGRSGRGGVPRPCRRCCPAGRNAPPWPPPPPPPGWEERWPG